MKASKAFNLVGILGLFMGAISTTIFYTHARYLPPAVDQKIDQTENRRRIESRTGLKLSPLSKILVASDGDPRDGTKGFFYWVVFSAERIEGLPEKRTDHFFKPDLIESIHEIEENIEPFKIKKPETLLAEKWRYGTTDCDATIVKGELGFYMKIRTFGRETQ